jgi:hypothetical protein
MLRSFFICGLALAGFWGTARAQYDGPPVVITSPDQATTFRFASIRQHELIWDKKTAGLIVHIVFTDVTETSASAEQDSHDFRLPGVTFDEKKGLFYATSNRGEIIPVARIKKTLFLKTIEPLPNANVRIEHPRGDISVVLEAIRPNDPAMRSSGSDAAAADTDAEGNHVHAVDIHELVH